jgi:hypothetical protein
VSKACDTVWVTGLIYKQHTAGSPDSSLLLLASYLADRKFTVTIEGKLSEWKPISAGVPQRVVLAPLVYNIVYVADISRRPGIEISQFADDSAAFTSKENINYTVNKLQRYISDLEPWLYKWKIKIDTDKSTAVMFIKRRQVPRKKVKTIRTRNSIVGRSKIFGRTLRKKFHMESTHKTMKNKAP